MAGYRATQWVWNSYRIVRLASPLTAVLAEFRSQVIGKMMTRVSAEFQLKLKQALLQEAVFVAIDLYSGRFRVKEHHQPAQVQDSRNMAPPLEPLRICFVGQTGSGKSSIINALVNAMVAEVNLLPSTGATTVHQCRIDGMEMVDLPGLDGNEKTTKNLLKEVTGCDLIIWVLKANQPARSLDSDFKQQLDAFYLATARRSQKRPVIIAVLNQVDRLPPVQEWHPPYDLEIPKTPKAKTIKAALEYNRGLLGFNDMIPLAVAENQPAYHLDELKRLLDTSCQQGLQTQLNRRRIQAGDVGPQHLTGSWSGAMGHTQFIPTSYLAYAVDMDGNGRRDIWNSVPDALATAANLLHRNGWQNGKTWGYEVILPAGGERWLDQTRTLADWQKAGFFRTGGRTFPRPDP